MSHYDFASFFHSLYDQAVRKYAGGSRGAENFFNPDEQTMLKSNGITSQHLYDYAEDEEGYNGEPGYDRALAIELVRRDYFLNVQLEIPSSVVLDSSSLPEKSASVRGIEWLPRIIPKAWAKLRGELPPSMMYCCGGDRKFLKEHDIFPSEFLSVVWRLGNDADAIVDWVGRRSNRS